MDNFLYASLNVVSELVMLPAKLSLPQTARTASLGIILLVTLGAICTAPVAAQSGTLVSDVDNQVSPDGTAFVEITAQQDGSELQISGDTAGWTIVSMDPFTTFTVPSSFNTDFPYESDGDETWSSGLRDAGETWTLTLAPPEDASDGDTYDFSVGTAEDSTISDSFSIDVVDQGAKFAITKPTDGHTVSVSSNEDFFINATVENIGSGTGDGSIALVVDGQQQDSTSVTGVASDDTAAVPLTGTAPSSDGTYDFSIEASPGKSISGTIDVTEPESDPQPSSDYEVTPDGDVTISFTADQESEISVSGETAGWTITNMDPFSSLTIPSNFNTDLPYTSESGDTWSSGRLGDSGDTFSLTLEPPADAENGDTYEFDVITTTLDGDKLAEETITITVNDVSYADLPDGVNSQTAAAVDDNSNGKITLEEIVKANINRSTKGEVNGVPITLEEIVKLNIWRSTIQ